MKCGLLGRKLGHSYSPQIHAHLGDYSYELFEKEPEEVADFLRNGDFSAINVTIPYKKTVMPYCGKLTERAIAMGSVNTIVRQPDGTLLGHNTDYFGFSSMVRRSFSASERRTVSRTFPPPMRLLVTSMRWKEVRRLRMISCKAC